MQLSVVRTTAYVFFGLITAALVLGGIGLVARGTNSSVAAAAHSASAPACATTGLGLANAYGHLAVISGSFQLTAGQVAAWQERSRGPNLPHVATSPWRTHAADEPVAVCYYDGVFDNLALPGGPPGYGATAPATRAIDRIIVLVDRTGAALYVASISSALPIEDPTIP